MWRFQHVVVCSSWMQNPAESRRRSDTHWKQRFEIIIDFCLRTVLSQWRRTKLHYPHRHQGCKKKLLDEKWVPKISDFGMARLYQEHRTHVNTCVAGDNCCWCWQVKTQKKCTKAPFERLLSWYLHVYVSLISFVVSMFHIGCGVVSCKLSFMLSAN